MIQDTIKDERNKRSLSQLALSKLIGVSQQTIGSWETGRTSPDLLMLVNLADFFDVTTDYLLGRTKNRKLLEPAQPPAAPPSTPALTPQEQDLLRKYRVLTDEHRGLLNGQLDAMYNLDKPKAEDEAM